MRDLSTVLDPGWATHASIYGHLYRACLGVKRWLELQEAEVLRWEGDEDLELLLLGRPGGWSEQVKAPTNGVTVRDEVIKETLRRFALSPHLLPAADSPYHHGFIFIFIFISIIHKPQTTDDSLTVDGLDVWDEATTDDKRAPAKSAGFARSSSVLLGRERGRKNRLELWQQPRDALARFKSDPGH